MAVESSSSTWSQRFEEGLHPAIERFNASIGFDITLLQQDLDGSIAHARMLASTGVITSEEAEQLVVGLEQVRSKAAAGQFNPGLEDEDVHFAVERRLIAILGPLGKKLHTGRSRNDQVGTDLRLWLRGQIDAIDGALVRFERALLAQAEAHAEVMIPGYTHLQRAQPICLAHHLLALPDCRHIGRILIASLDHQSAETLGHAALLFGFQCRLAAELGLRPIDKPLQPALQDGVIGRKIALPRPVALFDAQGVEREHPERAQAVALAGAHDGVPNRFGIGHLRVDFPAQFARKRHPAQPNLGPGDAGGLMREPALGQISIRHLGQNGARFRPRQDLGRPFGRVVGQ